MEIWLAQNYSSKWLILFKKHATANSSANSNNDLSKGEYPGARVGSGAVGRRRAGISGGGIGRNRSGKQQAAARRMNTKEVKENVSERTPTRQVKLVALLSCDGRSLLVRNGNPYSPTTR